MDIEGKIIAVIPAREGKSERTGTQWKSQDYVIETHDQYPRRCCFNVYGSDKIQLFDIKLGEELRVSFDLDARISSKGNWFNSIRAWKVERIDPNAAAQAPAQPVPFDQPLASSAQSTVSAAPAQEAAPFPPQSEGGSEDDLPF